MINSQSFGHVLLPAIPAYSSFDQVMCFVCSPSLELGLSLVRVNLDILVHRQGVDSHSGSKKEGASHYTNQWIDGRIREEILFEGKRVDFE